MGHLRDLFGYNKMDTVVGGEILSVAVSSDALNPRWPVDWPTVTQGAPAASEVLRRVGLLYISS